MLLAVAAGVFALLWILFGDSEAELSYSQLSIESGKDYRVGDGTISYVADSRLTYYSVSDKKSRATALNAEVDGYAVRNDTIVLYDGGMLHIEGANAVQLVGTVREVRMGKDYIAALHTNEQGLNSIVIFDYQGNMVSSAPLDFSDSKVTNFDFYTENGRELLWVVSVETEQSTPVTTVKMYDYGAGGSISNLAPFYDQSVEKLYFTEDSIFVVGTQDIVRYAISGGREKYRVNIYGNKVIDMVTSEGTATFLLAPRNEVTWNTLRIIRTTETDEATTTIRQYSVPEPIIGAYLQDSGIRAVGQQNVYIFGYSGKLLNTLQLKHVPQRVCKLNDTTLLLICEDGLYRTIVK